MLTDIESLELKIARHDRHRFETKLDISVVSGRKTAYRIETYFFIPKGLNINPITYKKSDFYNNIQNNIRYKTPRIEIEKLLDKKYTHSPLNKIEKYLESIVSLIDGEITKNLIYEIKMLGCISREILRDSTETFLNNPDGFTDGEEEILTFIHQLNSIISRIGYFRKKIFSLKTNPEVRETFGFFDDFFSLNIIEYLSVFLKAMRDKNVYKSAIGQTDAVLKSQTLHRRKMKYVMPPCTPDKSENLIYRRSILKKFVSSVLFLNIKTLESTPFYQILLGFSAAIAMLFAAVIMLLAQSRFAVNSFPFVVVLVVSYIFKDRIKDWLKIWFTSHWTKWIYDRKRKIYHTNPNKPMGIIKDAFSFVDKNKLADEILNYRRADSLGSVYEQGKPESVIKYEKEVFLNIQKSEISDIRKKDINDIMRMNVYSFLTHADDPESIRLYYDDKTGDINPAKCIRTYHINVITRYTSYNKSGVRPEYERIRLVVTRDGILRLEEVLL